MTDNYQLIRKMLEWRTEDDFYFLQIIQRKKDHKDGTKVNGSNNNSRLIKAYYVKSLEHFDFIQNEVKLLCELFNARAGINLNRRSWRKTQLQTMRKILEQQINEEYQQTHRAFNTVCGMHSNEGDKKWILDIDGEVNDRHLNSIILFAERECMPEGDKFINVVPSKNGKHIIMKPFDIKKFREEFPEIEIHKNNPTNLYIP